MDLMYQSLIDIGYTKKQILKFLKSIYSDIQISENELEEKLSQYLSYEDFEKLINENEEQISGNKNEKPKFERVNHKYRAEKFGRLSDGNTTSYLNVALKYFGNRCALSGEEFAWFNEEITNSKAISNLSAEHVVPLCQGGDDVYPNLVPTILQYNLSKNGYYLLDWWSKQKNSEGTQTLYSPFRLLKLANFMMKSLDARKQNLTIKQYEKAILAQNEIDEFLAKIEAQDMQETDNKKRKIISSTVTTIQLEDDGIEDGKKILKIIPDIEGNIPTLEDEKHQIVQNDDTMMDVFLYDSIKMLKEDEQLCKYEEYENLMNCLDEMYEKVIDVIPLEVRVRNKIFNKLESFGVKTNKYTITNAFLRNTELLKIAKENEDKVEEYLEKYFKEKKEQLRKKLKLTNEEIKTAIENIPEILYDKKVINRINFYKRNRKNHLQDYIEGKNNSTDNLVDILIILQKHKKNVREIKQRDTLEEYLKRQLISQEEIDQIKREIEEIGITKFDNIGDMLSRQKADNKIDSYKKALKEAINEKEEPIFLDEIIDDLTEKEKISIDQTKDFVDILIILYTHKIDIRKIMQDDTLEEYLKKQNVKKEEIEKIQKEVEEKNIPNLNIGKMQKNQRTDNNVDKYRKALKEAVNEKGTPIFSTEIIDILTGRKRSRNQTKDFVDILIILHTNGMDVTKIMEYDTLEKYLNNQDAKQEKIEKIKKEIEEKGIDNLNIGTMQNTQKKDKNIKKYKKALKESVNEKGNRIFSDEIINILTEKKTQSTDQTKDLLDTLIILHTNGIDIKKIIQSEALEANLKRQCTNQKKITEIIKKIEEKGISNLNIGVALKDQKKDENLSKFKKALKKAVNEEGKRIFSDEIIKGLTEKETQSTNQTKDFLNILIILYTHGTDIRKLTQRDTLETYLKKQFISQEKIDQIKREIEEKGIEKLTVGHMLSKQKYKYIDKLKKALEEAVNEKGDRIFPDEIINDFTKKKENTSQDIGKASYTASTQGCDEKQEILKELEKDTEEKTTLQSK